MACENNGERPKLSSPARSVRHRLLADPRRTKVLHNLSSYQQDALMFIAQSRLCCLRPASIARFYHSAAKMEKRDYAVSPRHVSVCDSEPS